MRSQVLFILMDLIMISFAASSSNQRQLRPILTQANHTISIDDNQPGQSMKDCPVTKSGVSSFVPPAPNIKLSSGLFWLGTDKLWTSLPESGAWTGLPYSTGGYSQKTFWWSDDYSAVAEPQPDLYVTGVNFDSPGKKVLALSATHAIAVDIGTAMLVGIVLPSMGCWEISGTYKDSSLRYVIWIS